LAANDSLGFLALGNTNGCINIYDLNNEEELGVFNTELIIDFSVKCLVWAHETLYAGMINGQILVFDGSKGFIKVGVL
jgi:hypothetical protein